MENQIAYAEKGHKKERNNSELLANKGLILSNKQNVEKLEYSKQNTEEISMVSVAENYKKLINQDYINEYKNTYGIRKDIEITSAGIEYANILLNKNLENANSVINLMNDSIKQAMCFEVIKNELNVKELNKDTLLEIHQKAEILTNKISHEELSYQNRYKLFKTIEKISDAIKDSDLPKENELNSKDIGKSSQVIETEKTLETQKQQELQNHQSMQKSRGFEMEI